jgi:hypothetical protein
MVRTRVDPVENDPVFAESFEKEGVVAQSSDRAPVYE